MKKNNSKLPPLIGLTILLVIFVTVPFFKNSKVSVDGTDADGAHRYTAVVDTKRSLVEIVNQLDKDPKAKIGDRFIRKSQMFGDSTNDEPVISVTVEILSHTKWKKNTDAIPANLREAVSVILQNDMSVEYGRVVVIPGTWRIKAGGRKEYPAITFSETFGPLFRFLPDIGTNLVMVVSP